MPEPIVSPALPVGLIRKGTYKPRDHYPQARAARPKFYTARLLTLVHHATAWRISPTLAAQMKARAEAKTRSQLHGSSPIGTFARIYPVLFAMPSLFVEAFTARVTSLSFPSLRKVGDLYSKRLDSPSGSCF